MAQGQRRHIGIGNVQRAKFRQCSDEKQRFGPNVSIKHDVTLINISSVSLHLSVPVLTQIERHQRVDFRDQFNATVAYVATANDQLFQPSHGHQMQKTVIRNASITR